MKKENGAAYTIALAGNPNSGKSTLFNLLTGMKQHTGNWAGKTVESAAGEFHRNGKRYRLIDLPGIYSLSCQSAEEKAAYDFIADEHPDAVIVVCDSTCLERGLILAAETKSLGCPMVLCAGLIDEAEKCGFRIDFEKMSELLGVPTAGISARKKIGIDHLLDILDNVLMNNETSDEKEPELPTSEEAAGKAEEIFRECVSVPENAEYERNSSVSRFLDIRSDVREDTYQQEVIQDFASLQKRKQGKIDFTDIFDFADDNNLKIRAYVGNRTTTNQSTQKNSLLFINKLRATSFILLFLCIHLSCNI